MRGVCGWRVKCQPAVAVAGGLADVGAEPGGGNEGVGGGEGGEFHLDEEQAGVDTVEDVELGGEAAVEGDAVAGLVDEVAVALGAQVGVAVGAEGELLLAVLYGRRGGTHLLLDGEDISIARPADAQGGRCAEVALLYLDMRTGFEVGREIVYQVFTFNFHQSVAR